ncbi:MAG: hypothetical protein SV253_04400 [Halobacteria archaeon]|nr:hypothetical protein [Halobacteria archaeon]
MEPLATAELDGFLSPDVLRIRLDDGIGDAQSSRIDVVWTVHDDYNIHYTDDAGRDFRWDLHPHEYPRPADDRHFHPPPDASTDTDDVEESCIQVSEIELVARAVHELWRRAYETGSMDGVNGYSNPP